MQSVLRYLDLGSLALAMLVGFITLFLLEIYRLSTSKSKCPPGPMPLPFIGIEHRFIMNRIGSIRSMVDYGEMSCVYIGSRPMIVLNTLDVVKEALVENSTVFSGRPYMPVIEWLNRGNGIVTATYGHAWKQQRRFALHMLRNFGLGRKSVEERVAEEAQCLIKELLKHEGKVLNPFHLLMNAVSNIICSIVFGDRFEYDNKHFAKLMEIMNENIRLSGSPLGLLVNIFPITIYLPGPHQKIFQQVEALREFIRKAMVEHKKTLDPENLRDFIDAYLVEISKGTVVVPNLTAIMTDKRAWKYPDSFNPENFLDEDGKFCKNEFFLPFSLGPRVCLGEALARTELFIFFTSLLQRLKFSWPPDAPPIDMDGIVGTVKMPYPFHMICRSRECSTPSS